MAPTRSNVVAVLSDVMAGVIGAGSAASSNAARAVRAVRTWEYSKEQARSGAVGRPIQIERYGPIPERSA